MTDADGDPKRPSKVRTVKHYSFEYSEWSNEAIL
jgi:hypothetical protein